MSGTLGLSEGVQYLKMARKSLEQSPKDGNEERQAGRAELLSIFGVMLNSESWSFHSDFIRICIPLEERGSVALVGGVNPTRRPSSGSS